MKTQSSQYVWRGSLSSFFSCRVQNRSDKVHVFTFADLFRTSAFLTMLDPFGNKLFKAYYRGGAYHIIDVSNGDTVAICLCKGFFNPKLIIAEKVDGQFFANLTLRRHLKKRKYVLTNFHNEKFVASTVARDSWFEKKWDIFVEPGYDGPLMSLILFIMIKSDYDC